MNNDLPVWFPSRGIYFSKIQLQRFIFPELNDLRFGDYPPEPDEYITYVKGGWIEMKRSGYEKSGRKLTNHNAPFLAAAEIAAEIDSRLAMIPLPQRYWIMDNLTDGMEYWEIAKFYHVAEDQVRSKIGRMIRYMVGSWRADVDYKEWNRTGCKYKVIIPV
jgi:DNA-directed RNA polymerase specialized sigma24 family protein